MRITAAYGKSRLFCLRRCFDVCAVALLILAAGLTSFPASAEQNQSAVPQAKPVPLVVDRILFDGARRIRNDVLRARIFTREGDAYNPVAIDKDYHALWATGYFDDVYVTVENSPDNPNGRIVTFHVKERPTIRRIEFKGNKSVSESDILDAWKDRKVGLTQDSQFDPTKVKKAEVVIRDLLSAHGHQFAAVNATFQSIPATNTVILTFNVVEGAKVKVGKITIVGNHAFSSRRIIRAMRHSRPYGFDAKFFGMNVMAKTFDQTNLDEDEEVGIREDLYRSAGYYDVVVETTSLNTVDDQRKGPLGAVPLVGNKNGKATNITIQIKEGDRFKMGKLFIVNADPEKGLQLKHDFLVNAFPLKEGDILNVDKIRKAVESYTKLYGQFGFMDFTAEPRLDENHETKTIDVTLRFSEAKPYYIHRINISGNVTTRDKVIRRELLLNEGDLYNNRAWEYSVLKLNQLNFFDQLKPETAATVVRNVKAGTVDLNLKVREKQKQSISFTGGASGISGDFIGLSYQTNNFLGLGETLTLQSQFGTVQRLFQIGFTEPYLFDRPITTGFTLFDSRYNFDQARAESILLGQPVQLSPSVAENYNQNSKGGTVFASYPIKRLSRAGFTRLAISYGFTDTNIVPFSNAATLLFTAIQFQSVAGPSAVNGIHQSRVTTTLSYNSVDNPVDPKHGKNIYYSFALEGGPLGGNTKAINNLAEFAYFRPTYHKRNTLAFRVRASFETSYGGEELPPFERYFLGGEQDLRAFDIQTVSPIAFIPVSTSTPFVYTDPRFLDGSGNPRQFSTAPIPTYSYTVTFPGGDTEGLFNAEYRIPIAGPVSLSFYNDIGTVGVLRRDQLNLNPTALSSFQTTFPTSTFGTQLQLAPGSNFRPRASGGAELVVKLPIVQAPFRLYWAYNYLRYDTFIVAPVGNYAEPADVANVLAGTNIWEQQIVPQLNRIVNNPQQFKYADPLHTLRFTVSRTF